MDIPISFWIGFNAVILFLLAADLFFFNRRSHAIGMKEAALTSAAWVGLSALFGVFVWQYLGREKALEFFTGYLVEYSLSVDNLFVFVVIFSYFSVQGHLQHRVLFWGILGALIMRGTMILAVGALVDRYHWVLYLFGLFLCFTGLKLLFTGDQHPEIEKNPVLRLCRRFFNVSSEYDGQKFLIKRDGKLWLTPLALVLIVVEVTDLVFAVDSIPAVFAITKDPFIVYTSNICAILGLRSLYFLLAGMMGKFAYLKIGLALILCFIGSKMLLADLYRIPTNLSLAIVVLILAASVALSMLRTRSTIASETGSDPGQNK